MGWLQSFQQPALRVSICALDSVKEANDLPEAVHNIKAAHAAHYSCQNEDLYEHIYSFCYFMHKFLEAKSLTLNRPYVNMGGFA